MLSSASTVSGRPCPSAVSTRTPPKSGPLMSVSVTGSPPVLVTAMNSRASSPASYTPSSGYSSCTCCRPTSSLSRTSGPTAPPSTSAGSPDSVSSGSAFPQPVTTRTAPATAASRRRVGRSAVTGPPAQRWVGRRSVGSRLRARARAPQRPGRPPHPTSCPDTPDTPPPRPVVSPNRHVHGGTSGGGGRRRGARVPTRRGRRPRGRGHRRVVLPAHRIGGQPVVGGHLDGGAVGGDPHRRHAGHLRDGEDHLRHGEQLVAAGDLGELPRHPDGHHGVGGHRPVRRQALWRQRRPQPVEHLGARRPG